MWYLQWVTRKRVRNKRYVYGMELCMQYNMYRGVLEKLVLEVKDDMKNVFVLE